MLHVVCKCYAPEMRDKEALGCQGGKKRSAICQVMREANTRGKGAQRTVFVTIPQQMKGVKHVQATQDHGFADIFHGGVLPEPVVDTPIAVRERRASRHSLNSGFVLFSKIFE